MVHANVSGVGSVLPAASVALTEKVCDVLARLVYAFGGPQPVKAAPSSEHWNVELPSLAVNPNDTALPEGFPGALVIVVLGGVKSTDHVNAAGVPSVFPAASVARTRKVYVPSANGPA